MLVGWSLASTACGGDEPDDVDADSGDVGSDVDPADGGDSDIANSDASDDTGEPDADPLVRYTEDREPCLQRSAERNLYWGDLHIHTRYSFDSWVVDTRAEPADAYRFARGEALLILPLDDDGNPTNSVQLDRPLDFAAVTDHSEYLAEIDTCTTPGSDGYDLEACESYRTSDTVVAYGGRLTDVNPRRFPEICDNIDCEANMRDVWRRTRDDADAHYDRTSACEFTTFHGYEYSNARRISNLHRNVIFRNDRTPDHVTSLFEEPTPTGLLDRLYEDCIEGIENCDVMAIPHNSNWSNGNMFTLEYPTGASLEDQRAQAQRRADMEPLVEIFQHKGDSECVNGLSSAAAAPDELCDFEKLRDDIALDCRNSPGFGAMAGLGCTSRFDFVRYVLKEGLAEAERIGVNPFQLGIVAGTDTHNATPGLVEESAWQGHFGDDEIDPLDQLADPPLTPGGIIMNPGGITGVWAVENSRDAVFEALRRREVFGTSGPRISVRMFAGHDLPEDLCDRADQLEVAYRDGVPMGGELLGDDGATDSELRILVSALSDPGTAVYPGTDLQRVQVIKGWLDADGELHEQVIDVAGDRDNGASVDLNTCAPQGDGAASLCTVWTDDDFDPEQRAFYYARVVQNPTCRWSTWDCIRLPEGLRPANCSNPEIAQTVQERAWSSPIWYTP